MAQEECAQQRCDVQAVRIRIGKDANLVIPQIVEICITRVDTQRNTDVMYLLRPENFGCSFNPSVAAPSSGARYIAVKIKKKLYVSSFFYIL